MWKISYFRQLVSKPLNFRTITILADGNVNGKNKNKKLCTASKMDLENPNAPVPFSELDKNNFKNYQFPIIKISYDREDAVEHAISVGVQPGDKHADSYLNKRNVNFQVLPSFILPFSNKILKDMVVLIPSWNKYNAFHGEHYFEQLKQLPPEGIINWEIKILDLLDKGKATVYCFSINGYDENGETYFESEYQLFEVGTGGFNGNKTNPHLSRLAEPKTTIPDAILEFPLFVPKGGYKEMMSDSDMEISFYSPLHPRQHYSRHPDIPDPVPHGRYMFSGVIRIILFEYGNANADKLKAAKIRFDNLVLPGEKILISTWKEDSRIIFEGDVQRNGKKIKVFSGGYIDFHL